jgi:hypothetical protein
LFECYLDLSNNILYNPSDFLFISPFQDYASSRAQKGRNDSSNIVVAGGNKREEEGTEEKSFEATYFLDRTRHPCTTKEAGLASKGVIAGTRFSKITSLSS